MFPVYGVIEGFLGARASRPQMTGTASDIPSTWIDRQRHPGSPSAWPLRLLPT